MLNNPLRKDISSHAYEPTPSQVFRDDMHTSTRLFEPMLKYSGANIIVHSNREDYVRSTIATDLLFSKGIRLRE